MMLQLRSVLLLSRQRRLLSRPLASISSSTSLTVPTVCIDTASPSFPGVVRCAAAPGARRFSAAGTAAAPREIGERRSCCRSHPSSGLLTWCSRNSSAAYSRLQRSSTDTSSCCCSTRDRRDSCSTGKNGSAVRSSPGARSNGLGSGSSSLSSSNSRLRGRRLRNGSFSSQGNGLKVSSSSFSCSVPTSSQSSLLRSSSSLFSRGRSTLTSTSSSLGHHNSSGCSSPSSASFATSCERNYRAPLRSVALLLPSNGSSRVLACGSVSAASLPITSVTSLFLCGSSASSNSCPRGGPLSTSASCTASSLGLRRPHAMSVQRRLNQRSPAQNALGDSSLASEQAGAAARTAEAPAAAGTAAAEAATAVATAPGPAAEDTVAASFVWSTSFRMPSAIAADAARAAADALSPCYKDGVPGRGVSSRSSVASSWGASRCEFHTSPSFSRSCTSPSAASRWSFLLCSAYAGFGCLVSPQALVACCRFSSAASSCRVPASVEASACSSSTRSCSHSPPPALPLWRWCKVASSPSPADQQQLPAAAASLSTSLSHNGTQRAAPQPLLTAFSTAAGSPSSSCLSRSFDRSASLLRTAAAAALTPAAADYLHAAAAAAPRVATAGSALTPAAVPAVAPRRLGASAAAVPRSMAAAAAARPVAAASVSAPSAYHKATDEARAAAVAPAAAFFRAAEPLQFSHFLRATGSLAFCGPCCGPATVSAAATAASSAAAALPAFSAVPAASATYSPSSSVAASALSPSAGPVSAAGNYRSYASDSSGSTSGSRSSSNSDAKTSVGHSSSSRGHIGSSSSSSSARGRPTGSSRSGSSIDSAGRASGSRGQVEGEQRAAPASAAAAVRGLQWLSAALQSRFSRMRRRLQHHQRQTSSSGWGGGSTWSQQVSSLAAAATGGAVGSGGSSRQAWRRKRQLEQQLLQWKQRQQQQQHQLWQRARRRLLLLQQQQMVRLLQQQQRLKERGLLWLAIKRKRLEAALTTLQHTSKDSPRLQHVGLHVISGSLKAKDRLKALWEKYGWASVVAYAVVHALTFLSLFGAAHAFDDESIKWAAEKLHLTKILETEQSSAAGRYGGGAFWGRLLFAYAACKPLTPLQVGLAIWATPPLARCMRRHGVPLHFAKGSVRAFYGRMRGRRATAAAARREDMRKKNRGPTL